VFLASALLASPRVADAAESYDNCSAFITSLPAVIATQGTWCFNKDLNTAITSGTAITINTNNVTIDCNNFKLGGLAAGIGTSTFGIAANDRANITVRHCNIRGFIEGIDLLGSSSSGHIVESNRLDGNTFTGIEVHGDGSVVRHNLVFDTGGNAPGASAYGISTGDSVDVLDNTVSGVAAASSSNGNAFGIFTFANASGSISANRVRDLAKDGSGVVHGIFNQGSSRIALTDNHVVGDGSAGSDGLECVNNKGRAKDNLLNGFATGITGCNDDGGNVIVP